MSVTRQYFELQGELLDMAIAWKRGVSDPHHAKVYETLRKEFGTTRAVLYSWSGGKGISAVGDDAAPIDGMVPSKKNPGFLVPSNRKEGKAKSAILKSLDYPIAGAPVLEKLRVFKELWTIDSYLCSPEFFQIDDRWFVGVPVEKVPIDWLTNTDLMPMLPYVMHQLESAQKETAIASLEI
jgi:hypothetical protein